MLDILKNRSKMLGVAMPAIALLCSANAHAENGFIIGLGASYDKDIYLGGKEGSVEAMPYLAYETQRFHIGTDEISYALMDRDNSLIEVFGELRELDSLENDALFKSLERGTAIELGLRGDYALGPVVFSGSSQLDVTDAHEGFETRIGIGRRTEIFGGEFELTFSGIYRDEKLNHYLYGVDKKDGIANVALFEPEAQWTSELDAQYIYPLSDQLLLVAGSSIEFLGDAAKDSPRLKRDADENVSAFLGFLWQF